MKMTNLIALLFDHGEDVFCSEILLAFSRVELDQMLRTEVVQVQVGSNGVLE